MSKVEELERRVSIWDDGGDEELAKVNMTLDGLTVKQLLAVVRAAQELTQQTDVYQFNAEPVYEAERGIRAALKALESK